MSGAAVVVVGGGIAGVTVAAELAAAGESVLLLEAEDALARHTTGRSAASYIPGHGARAVRALIAASRARFDDLAVAAGHPFLRPRPVLHVATEPDEERIVRERLARLEPVTLVDPAEAVRRWPALRPDRVRAAALVEGAADADPTGLHEHARRALLAAGGSVRTGARVHAIDRRGPGWRVGIAGGTGTGPVGAGPDAAAEHVDADRVVLAAGAWTDVLLALAGATPIGFTPLRRTIALARVPAGAPVRPDDPFVCSAGERWYAKPEGEHLLVSPSEETPAEPGDPRPDELDVALALERVNGATTLGLRSVATSWTGLRTFAPDRALVVGDRSEHPGLHLFAGQGGSGIESAPAAAALAAAVVRGVAPPADLHAHGVHPADTAATRFGPRAPAPTGSPPTG